MRHSLPLTPQFYVTAPQPCPYLPGRMERKLFTALQGEHAQKLNDTVSRLDSILGRADDGEGTLGQLVRNPALYNNATDMIANANHLVTAIRENPKTYLTFHVKIF